MLRKLLIICCLFSSRTVFAQGNNNAVSPENLKQMGVNQPVEMHAAKDFPKDDVRDYKTPGAPLPDFIVKATDGRIITNKDIQYKGNLFLMIFNPTCSHCEEMTDMLEKNMLLFNKTKLLMVATSPMAPYMKEFEKRHHTHDFPSIQVGLDSARMIDKVFSYKMLPQINVYDKDRKLIRSFYGDTPIDSLKSYIE